MKTKTTFLILFFFGLTTTMFGQRFDLMGLVGGSGQTQQLAETKNGITATYTITNGGYLFNYNHPDFGKVSINNVDEFIVTFSEPVDLHTITTQLNGSTGYLVRFTPDNNNTTVVKNSTNIQTQTKIEVNWTDVTTFTMTVDDNGNNINFSAYITEMLANTVVPIMPFSPITKTYGDEDFDLNLTSDSPGIITYSKVSSSDGGSLTLSGDNYQTVSLGNAGSVLIRATLPAAGYYSSLTKDRLITINKAPLIATVNNKTREYGDSNSFIISYSGLKNDDTPSVIDQSPTISTAASRTANVGVYPVTLSGGYDNNYTFSNYISGEVNVTKALIEVKAENKTKEYGDENPSLTIKYTGFKNGENNSVIDDNSFYVETTGTLTSHTGSYPIRLLGSASDNNYFFYKEDGNLIIERAPLTIKAINTTNVYGGNFPPIENYLDAYTYSGLKLGETSIGVNPSISYDSNSKSNDANAGTYVISMSGGNSTDYNITYVDGTYIINKAPLTVTFDSKSREYGAENPEFTYTLSGFVNGDTVSDLDDLPVGYSEDKSKGPGVYPIKVSSGSDNNYEYQRANLGKLTIIKAPLTVTFDNKTREYGLDNPEFTYTLSGFVNGDTVSDLDDLPVGYSEDKSKSPGVYSIKVSSGSDNNYEYQRANLGKLTITKAPLLAQANNILKAYGEMIPALSIKYGGFRNGDTSSDLRIEPEISSTISDMPNAGLYNINVTGGEDDNYALTHLGGKITILKAKLYVTADDKIKKVGEDNPEFTFVYDGFKYGETENILESLPVASTTATKDSPIGSYPITLSLSGDLDENYDFEFIAGTLTIENALNVDELELKKIKIYYSEMTQSVKVGGLNSSNKVSFSMFNILGKEVYKESFYSNVLNQIFIPKVKSGVYIVKISDNKIIKTKKIIIK